MEQTYTYGVARIRALEASLFSGDVMNSLLQCGDFEDCMNFLRGKGWGNGNPEQSLEEMLQMEESRADKILHELVEDKEQCEILTINNEFHNLKAAIKKLCTDQKTQNIYFENTALAPEILEDCIRQGNYNMLPNNMSDSAKEATEILLRTGDGQLCDIIVDKASLEALKLAGEKSENHFIKDYAKLQLLIADIKIAVRCAAAGKDSEFSKKALVDCPGLNITELSQAVDNGVEGVTTYLDNIGFGEAVAALQKSKSAFECWCDNRVIDEMKSQKYESFSLGPILAYVLARKNEIKTVKIILSGKLNGFDDEFIKERIRKTYV